jgi:hypothetical protein
MISPSRTCFAALAGAALLAGVTPRVAAQPADPEAHPAGKVVREYLGMIITRQWKKSADIVDPRSMEVLHRDYVQRIEDARTMDDEDALIRRVGKFSRKEVESMTPREFYTAFHEGLQEKFRVEEAKLEMIRKTITIKLLSVAEEGERTAHILVRAKYSTGEYNIERLELVSLLKNGDKWQVALNEQAPKATPVGPAPPGGAKPAEPVKPAADPVKPATPPKATTPPKPAPKPTPKPTTRPKQR